MELLNLAIIEQQLTVEAKRYFSPIEIFSALDSTNTYLLSPRHKTGAVCLAEQQTAGRGRQGREWASPYARNIYLSALCEVPNNEYLSGLSLVAGLAVIHALQVLEVPGLQIKWPNDIVHQNRKLAGILTEVARQSGNSTQVVVGIGINVDMPEEVAISQPWVDIKALTSKPLARNGIVGQVLNALYERIKRFNRHQLAEVVEQWPLVDALRYKPVKIQQGRTVLTGIAQGIDAEGRLQLQHEGKNLAIGSGEVIQLRTE